MSDGSPIYLFADSQLLFWKQESRLYLKSLLKFISHPQPRAAYIGASNGDRPEYFAIFRAAMEGIGIHRCRMIRAEFAADDREFLERSDLVLLAGGDVVKGWRAFHSSGLKEAIFEKHRSGAVLIGISAGAVQLGFGMRLPDNAGALNTFQLVPFTIDVHAQSGDWSELEASVRSGFGYGRGLGIEAGAGMVFHPDQTVEPLRRPLREYCLRAGEVSATLLYPDASAGLAVDH